MWNWRTLPCIVLALTALQSTAVGQDATRADFEDHCRFVQGRWVGKIQLTMDLKGIGNNGDIITAYSEHRVTDDGYAIVGRFYGGTGSASWITFYDAQAKRIKSRTTTSGGDTWSTVLYKDGAEWVGRLTGSTDDGKRLTGENRTTVSDAGDTHNVSGHWFVEGENTDPFTHVWRRVGNWSATEGQPRFTEANQRKNQTDNANDNPLERLSFLIGDWQGAYKSTSDVPELGMKVGSRIDVTLRWRWIHDRSAIELAVDFVVDGKPVPSSREIAYWDSSQNKIAHSLYGVGFSGKGTWQGEGADLELKWSASSTAGNTYAGRSKHHRVHDDEYTWHIVDQTKNGNKMADTEKVHLTRMPPPESPGQRKMRELAFLVGEWESSDETGTTQPITRRFINNQSFIEYRMGEYLEIIGWDPRTERYLVWLYGTNGGFGSGVLTQVDDTLWRFTADHFYDRNGFGIPYSYEIHVIDDTTHRHEMTFGLTTSTSMVRRLSPKAADGP